jgi:hypothetical protein
MHSQTRYISDTSSEQGLCYPHRCDDCTARWDSTMATTREELRKLLDDLPDDRLEAARAALVLLNVPDDDEPTTAEDLEAIARGREAYRRGETISDEVVRRELGL